MIPQRGNSLGVMVYFSPAPFTGRKKWVSRSVPGIRRQARKCARQLQLGGELLAEVANGRHRDKHGVKMAELVERWLEWHQVVKPTSPGTGRDNPPTWCLPPNPAVTTSTNN